LWIFFIVGLQLISHAAPDARLPLLQRRNYKWAKWHHLTVGAAVAAAVSFRVFIIALIMLMFEYCLLFPIWMCDVIGGLCR
jgi:hypothetical protein